MTTGVCCNPPIESLQVNLYTPINIYIYTYTKAKGDVPIGVVAEIGGECPQQILRQDTLTPHNTTHSYTFTHKTVSYTYIGHIRQDTLAQHTQSIDKPISIHTFMWDRFVSTHKNKTTHPETYRTASLSTHTKHT
jgi:hypothetical protein